MLAHLHIVPGAREEVVHGRGVWVVYVQAHRRGGMRASWRCTRKEVIGRFPEYREACLSLEGPECPYACRVGKESPQEALRFVCSTKVGGGDGMCSSTCFRYVNDGTGGREGENHIEDGIDQDDALAGGGDISRALRGWVCA